MINYIRRHLGVKLFLSYILVILVGVAVLGLASTVTVPTAFNTHMGGNLTGPGTGNAPGMGMMQGYNPGLGMMSDLYRNFQASFNEALLLAALAAGTVAILVSFLLTPRSDRANAGFVDSN